MNFTEIFNEDGLYVSDDGNFRKGVAYKVENRQLFMITYENKNSILYQKELPIVTHNTVNRNYIKIFNRNQLFD